MPLLRSERRTAQAWAVIDTGRNVHLRLQRTPTLGWHIECVEEILTRLQSQSSARIAVVDIPMIGEDLTSEMNRRVDSNNRAMTHVSLISTAFNLDRALGA